MASSTFSAIPWRVRVCMYVPNIDTLAFSIVSVTRASHRATGAAPLRLKEKCVPCRFSLIWSLFVATNSVLHDDLHSLRPATEDALPAVTILACTTEDRIRLCGTDTSYGIQRMPSTNFANKRDAARLQFLCKKVDFDLYAARSAKKSTNWVRKLIF